MDDYLTKQEVADFLNIKYPAVTYLLVSKQLPHIRRAASTFIPKEAVEAYKQAQDILLTLQQAA